MGDTTTLTTTPTRVSAPISGTDKTLTFETGPAVKGAASR